MTSLGFWKDEILRHSPRFLAGHDKIRIPKQSHVCGDSTDLSWLKPFTCSFLLCPVA